jgi:hypothetical protein
VKYDLNGAERLNGLNVLNAYFVFSISHCPREFVSSTAESGFKKDLAAAPSFGRRATLLKRCVDCCWQSGRRSQPECKIAHVLFDVRGCPGIGLRHKIGCSAANVPVIVGEVIKTRVRDPAPEEVGHASRASAGRRQPDCKSLTSRFNWPAGNPTQAPPEWESLGG